jgi:hypothetical protein
VCSDYLGTHASLGNNRSSLKDKRTNALNKSFHSAATYILNKVEECEEYWHFGKDPEISGRKLHERRDVAFLAFSIVIYEISLGSH